MIVVKIPESYISFNHLLSPYEGLNTDWKTLTFNSFNKIFWLMKEFWPQINYEKLKEIK
jgi:hypothetical protein